jgi:hypothetical protein
MCLLCKYSLNYLKDLILGLIYKDLEGNGRCCRETYSMIVPARKKFVV